MHNIKLLSKVFLQVKVSFLLYICAAISSNAIKLKVLKPILKLICNNYKIRKCLFHQKPVLEDQFSQFRD